MELWGEDVESKLVIYKIREKLMEDIGLGYIFLENCYRKRKK